MNDDDFQVSRIILLTNRSSYLFHSLRTGKALSRDVNNEWVNLERWCKRLVDSLGSMSEKASLTVSVWRYFSSNIL